MAEQCIAVIGAGGKSTAMEVLARQAPGPVLVTTTTHIFPAAGMPCLKDPGEGELASALQSGSPVCAGGTAKEGKLRALPPQVLAAGMQAARTVIYEGDGSKHLPLKLHRPGEPVILPETTAVLVLAGLSALGKPIGETVHRWERDPGWNPERIVDAEVFLHCVLETARSAGVSRHQIRIFLNQADACDPALAASLCARLGQLGFAARWGSLRQEPPGLYHWWKERSP